EEKIPSTTVPFMDYNGNLQIGRIYQSLGYPEKLREILEKVLIRKDVNKQMQMDVAKFYHFLLSDNSRAVEICENILEKIPFDQDTFSLIVLILDADGKFTEAEEYLNEWLVKYPTDTVARQLLTNIQQKKAAADTIRN
ncbi:tetratricopeptide repeat protein, partial [candidate division KSB1 bacterium]